MLTLDGSFGEGGGQILRTALALSLVTGTPFRITRIRAGRDRPGLLRQHRTAVEAACAVGHGTVEGNELHSTELTFRPKRIEPGDHSFAIGSAGSASLVVQTVLPPLLTASGPSRLTVEGATHNLAAPPFEFLEQTFLPLVNRMGPRVEAILHRPGFYPAGGGSLTVRVTPAPALAPFELIDRGTLQEIRAVAAVARLPRHIAERELAVVSEVLRLPGEACRVREISDSAGPGNIVLIFVRCGRLTETFAAFGRKGLPAEKVGREAAEAARRYIECGVAVSEKTADQILLPLAVGAGGRFTTLPLTAHATTNIAVIERFLPVRITTHPTEREGCIVGVG